MSSEIMSDLVKYITLIGAIQKLDALAGSEGDEAPPNTADRQLLSTAEVSAEESATERGK